MYDIMLVNCTHYLCVYLLSVLEELGENTDFIRHVWQTQGIGDSWCIYKCLEIINREQYIIPTEDCEQYHIIYKEPDIGRWIKTPMAVMGEGYMWYCDKCAHQVYQDSSRDYPTEKYCPNCGDKKIRTKGVNKCHL